MTSLAVNDAEASRLALQKVWEELAVAVDNARSYEEENRRDPSQMRDPLRVAYVRWASVFEREIAAVQTVYEATQAGAKLDAQEIRSARQIGEKLLGILTQARAQILQTS